MHRKAIKNSAKQNIPGTSKEQAGNVQSNQDVQQDVQQEGPPDFGDYGVGILAHRLDKLLAHTEGAKSGEDTVAIHQMRVWSRRSRASLDVFRSCFAGSTSGEFAQLEREVKNVTRALGAARDLDVMMETLQKRGETLPLEERGGVETFIAHLHAQRADRQQAVTDAVERLETRHLKQMLHDMAHEKGYHAVTLAAAKKEDAPRGTAETEGKTTDG